MKKPVNEVESNSDWDGKVAQSAEDLLGFSHWARTADKPCFGSLMKVVVFFFGGATSMDRSYESYINYIYIYICVFYGRSLANMSNTSNKKCLKPGSEVNQLGKLSVLPSVLFIF